MLKRCLYLLLILVVGFVPFLVTRAESTRFALLAISPTATKAVCVERGSQSVLAALSENGFVPRQDDTGFIYSLIGHTGPVSSDPAARASFWGFWMDEGDGLAFADRGPDSIKPQDHGMYVFSFGNGSAPTNVPALREICPDPVIPPLPATTENNQSAPVIPPAVPAGPSLATSISYLQNNFSTQALAYRDWGAMALGASERGAQTGATSESSVLSLARNALGRAAQGQDRTTLVDRIKASYTTGQLGEESLINDDIFGLLAIQTVDPNWLRTRADIFQTVISSQRSNGSFGYGKSGEGDTDMTAAAVWALVYAPTYPTETISRAFSYLNTTRANDGGYGYQPNTGSNIASSSWVLLAYRATGTPFVALENYLHAKRQADGSYLQSGQPNYLNTAYAVLALSGRKMPVVKSDQPSVTPPPTPQPAPQPNIQSPTTSARTIITSDEFGCWASASASASGTQATATAIASCN